MTANVNSSHGVHACVQYLVLRSSLSLRSALVFSRPFTRSSFPHLKYTCACSRTCMCAGGRACVRACRRAGVRTSVRVCARAGVRACGRAGGCACALASGWAGRLAGRRTGGRVLAYVGVCVHVGVCLHVLVCACACACARVYGAHARMHHSSRH